MANNIGGRWLDQDWRCPCGFRNAPIRAKCRNCRGPWKPEYRIAAEGSKPLRLRTGEGDTDDISGMLGLTNSADRPIQCGTFSEKPVRSKKVQFEQAERYVAIANRLMEHYDDGRGKARYER